MSAQPHEDELGRSDDERSTDRRRWFEHAIMLPVSLGMVTTFVVYGGRDLAFHLSGKAWPLTSLPDWALFVLTCAIALGALRLIRR